MKDEYIIINKTAIQKRIEELEQKRIELINNFDLVTDSIYKGRQEALNLLLSQSIPLIPEIEKSFDEGQTRSLKLTKQDYILQLKLNI